MREYDSLGFERCKNLSYPKESINLEFQENATAELISYYDIQDILDTSSFEKRAQTSFNNNELGIFYTNTS